MMDTEAQGKSCVHPIEGLMETAMENIKAMIDVNTVVGNAVETTDGTVIIPVSQVGCGFAAGGGEYELGAAGMKHPFAGGSGGGVSVKPVGFLIVRRDDVRLISVQGNQLAERLIDLAPQIFYKIQELMNGKDAPVQGTDRRDARL
jgi:sporulation protein YtfJ